jgi:hypothetical protein
MLLYDIAHRPHWMKLFLCFNPIISHCVAIFHRPNPWLDVSVVLHPVMSSRTNASDIEFLPTHQLDSAQQTCVRISTHLFHDPATQRNKSSKYFFVIFNVVYRLGSRKMTSAQCYKDRRYVISTLPRRYANIKF